MLVVPLAAALAETRSTGFTTFLHAGPGRQYAVTDEVPTHATVEVAGCDKGWCKIRFGGADGWIDQRMLMTARASAPPTKPAECVDVVRSGWPRGGDPERLCLQAPR